MSASPDRRSSPIVEQVHVFSLCKVENERSAVATDTGSVQSICNNLLIMGKKSLSQFTKPSMAVIGTSLLFRLWVDIPKVFYSEGFLFRSSI